MNIDDFERRLTELVDDFARFKQAGGSSSYVYDDGIFYVRRVTRQAESDSWDVMMRVPWQSLPEHIRRYSVDFYGEEEAKGNALALVKICAKVYDLTQRAFDFGSKSEAKAGDSIE